MNVALHTNKVAPNGMAARALLSILATAGLFYVNIMPALVDGLKVGLGFSNQQAGMVGSFNVYGAACGAFLIAFLVRKINWRVAAHVLLVGLIVMDLLSMPIANPILLAGIRFLHGVIGGMLVGVSYSIFARTEAPDRTFGMLLLVQAGASGIAVMSLPLLVPVFGTKVLFFALISFSALALVMLQFLPDYRVDAPAPGVARPARGISHKGLLLLAMSAAFLYQAANMGLYAFVIGLGRNAGLEMTFISGTLGASNWVGMLGGLMVVVLSTRFGVLVPVVGGMALTILSTAALFHADLHAVWIMSNIIGAITWNFVISYLLGMCARFDRAGQAAVWGGFASKMGLASGPMAAALIVGDHNYIALIVMALGLLVVATLASAVPALRLDRGDVD
jgi:predicted MFS family arabinose efflux permease